MLAVSHRDSVDCMMEAIGLRIVGLVLWYAAIENKDDGGEKN